MKIGSAELGLTVGIEPKNIQGNITPMPLEIDENTDTAIQKLNGIAKHVVNEYARLINNELLKPIKQYNSEGKVIKETDEFYLWVKGKTMPKQRVKVSSQIFARRLSTLMKQNFNKDKLLQLKYYWAAARNAAMLDNYEQWRKENRKVLINVEHNMIEALDKQFKKTKGEVDIYAPFREFLQRLMPEEVIPKIDANGFLVDKNNAQTTLNLPDNEAGRIGRNPGSAGVKKLAQYLTKNVAYYATEETRTHKKNLMKYLKKKFKTQ